MVTSLLAVDSDVGTCLRVDAQATEVSGNGFKLHVRSWEDSVVRRARISWLAAPAKRTTVVKPIAPHLPPARFEVHGDALGKGWCAVTHRATSSTDGLTYAVKTSRFPFRQDEASLLQELRNLAMLPLHPNLLRYHECIFEAGRLHIVTECMNAYRLADLVPLNKVPGSRTGATVLRWLSQILDGLATLHSIGLVHRDLHGENILIEKALDGTPSEGQTAVRLIDFGAAGHQGTLLKPRLMSLKAGFPQYFSPQRRRGEPFDSRDDVWAAGCHLVELASRQRISQRQDCGLSGADFAVTPTAVKDAVSLASLAGDQGERCQSLAQALLELSASDRPTAARARDMARHHVSCISRKRPSGPSGGPRKVARGAAPTTLGMSVAAVARPGRRATSAGRRVPLACRS